MAREETVVRFEEVSFEYGHNKPILEEVSFGVRSGMKIAVMGQNGAGKSTLFELIAGTKVPESGRVLLSHGATIATAKQVIPRTDLDLSVRAFFEKCFDTKVYDIDPKIAAVLEVVQLNAPLERTLRTFSGGQQARLLLASALIQNPDILLLDEPTNNLDKAGIDHLTAFLITYPKTVIVISHDAEFLNAFTEGVLYLDVYTRKIEQYFGNYNNVQRDITVRIEKENRQNAQLAKEIQANKDKANFFAQKGGKMRLVAKKMRTLVEEMEEEKVDVRKEDKTIRPFTIPAQQGLSGDILSIDSFIRTKNHKAATHKAHVRLSRSQHLLVKAPNGWGKTTLLEVIARGTTPGVQVQAGVKIGYYRQDFSTLNFEHTAYESLAEAMGKPDEHKLRAVAAGFLISSESLKNKIGNLSEGQKGLVAFAGLVLAEPGLLILDEPTNHINFRHLPVIAKALSEYKGALVLVSHVEDFVSQIRIDEILDFEK